MSDPTRLDVFPSAGMLAKVAAAEIADRIEDAVERDGQALFVGAGGRTPIGVYQALAARPISWDRVRVTLTDERWVPIQSAESNERMLRGALLRDCARAARFVPLKAQGKGVEQGALEAERALRALGRPADVLLLGMGEDGRVASLYPDSPALADGLQPRVDRWCLPVAAAGQAPAEPRLSLTLRAIVAARRVLLLLTGPEKRRAFEQALRGLDPRAMPVRAVLRHARDLRVMWAP